MIEAGDTIPKLSIPILIVSTLGSCGRWCIQDDDNICVSKMGYIQGKTKVFVTFNIEKKKERNDIPIPCPKP